MAELDRLVAALEGATPEDARTLGATVPLRWRVQAEKDEVVVDGTWLVHELRDAAGAGDWTARRDRLRTRLADMRAHAAELTPAGDSDGWRQQSRLAVSEILARPEFQRSLTAQRLERLRQRVGEWLRALLQRVGAGGVTGRTAAKVVAWIAALAAFAGLGIYVARLLAASGRAVTLGVSHRTPTRMSAREWALRATAAARAGDAREAIRSAYRSAVTRLAEQGVWRIDHTRTPREYLRLLMADDVRRSPVEELTEQFEQVWYGNQTVDAGDVHRAGANLERLGCLSAAERAM